MRILHYALGFPPYRSGGLTKFCTDLLQQQNKEGHQVAMIWPGQINLINKAVRIKDKGNVHMGGEKIHIGSYEVINPLPISYDEGISDIGAFIKDVEEQPYYELLSSFKPDVIHVHTLMGLHKAFLSAAKKCGIRVVFSAHDFFPICPKVTMFRAGRLCASIQSCEECGVCNSTALSLKKITILQSPLYRGLKNTVFVKRMRKQHRDAYLNESTAETNAAPVGSVADFRRLRGHYHSMLQMMDMLHYNSTVTKAAYEAVFQLDKNCIISITHSDIQDNRRRKTFSDSKLRIRYLGPAGGAKGFFAQGGTRQVMEYKTRLPVGCPFCTTGDVAVYKCA